MALSTEWVALKTGQSGSGGVEYSKELRKMIEYNKDVTDIILRVLADIDLANRWRSDDDSGEFIERLVQLEERSIQVSSLEEKIIILQNQLTSLRNGLRSHKNINKEPEELPF